MNATALQPATPRSTLAVNTPAKINLTLRVIVKRNDGFHDLQSLVIGVDLCDRLDCALTEHGPTLHCSDPALCTDDNLVLRSIRELARQHHITPTIQMELTKRIPIGAGLGGGSSDAAATLQICNQLWDLRLSKDELASVGTEIGSDVPLFFSLPSAVIRGRGEHVQSISMAWKGWVALVQTGETVSTAEVYRQWKKEDSVEVSPEVIEEIQRAQSAGEIMKLSFNDLEQAVFKLYPNVAAIFTRLNSLSSGTFRLTGAGSVFYQLFDDQNTAHDTVATIKEELPDVTCTVVAAPVVSTQAL